MDSNEDFKMLNKTYNKLLPSINKIYNTYNYLGLTTVQFEKLIMEILQEIHNKKLIDKEDLETYLSRIKSYLDVYVKLRLEESENTLSILSNFINNKLSVSENTEQNLKQLKRFSNFLAKYNFVPTPDHFIELIKSNQKIAKMLQHIIEKNLLTVEKDGLQMLDDNPTVIMILDVYCMIHGIEYQKQDDEKDLYNKLLEEYDTYTVDSVKAYLLEIQNHY